MNEWSSDFEPEFLGLAGIGFLSTHLNFAQFKISVSNSHRAGLKLLNKVAKIHTTKIVPTQSVAFFKDHDHICIFKILSTFFRLFQSKHRIFQPKVYFLS